MTKPMIRIHNLETDEVIDREMTNTEFNAWQADQEAAQAQQAEAEVKAAARQAILNRLGLTEDEARLLLG